MKKNITIVWVNPYSANKGVAALAYSILFILNQALKNSKFEYSISIIGNANNFFDTIQISDISVPITNYKFIKLNSIKGIIKSIISPAYISNLFRTDYVLDMGEGDSFSDIYGLERFSNINSTKNVFRILRKKQLLLPQTIGPFSDENVRKDAHKSIEKSSVVLVRDKLSYEYVIQNTNQKNTFELIDVAFFMPFKKKLFSKEKINVGLNISALLWNGGYTQNNQFGLKIIYQSFTRNIIDYFLRQNSIQLHIIPHVVCGDYSIENDYAVSRLIIEEYNNPNMILAPFFLDPVDAKNYISGLDFFTGSRMHACIAAFSTGIPVFPLAYSRKFNGLFTETLDYQYIGDMVHQTEEIILKNLFSSFEKKDDLSANIQRVLNTIVTPRYTILLEQLKKFIET